MSTRRSHGAPPGPGRLRSILVGVGYLRSLDTLRGARLLSPSSGSLCANERASGKLQGEPVSGARSGTADARVRLALNLLGGPALTPAEYASYRQRRNLGVSLKRDRTHRAVRQQSSDQLRCEPLGIQAGNRLLQHPRSLDLRTRRRELGCLPITTTSPQAGRSRKQDPIGSNSGACELHLQRRRLGVSGRHTTSAGVEPPINGEDKGDPQRTSRTGTTLSIPLREEALSQADPRQTGAYTRLGADFGRPDGLPTR